MTRLMWILSLVALVVIACDIDSGSIPEIGDIPLILPTSTSVAADNTVQESDPIPTSTVEAVPAATPAPGALPAAKPDLTGSEISIKEKLEILRNTSRALAALAADPAPIGMEVGEVREFARYAMWLKSSSEEIDDLLQKTEESQGSGLMEGTKAMQEMNQSFNLHYLNLQQKMEQENRKSTMVSNIMKARHKKAREAIDKVR
jgi:hypothetical protein